MNNDLKQKIMREIEKKADVFIKSSAEQYRIRCPICGDSQKNLRDAHCYLKCSYDPNEPILFICFKCNAHGAVGRSFLEKMQIDPKVINMVGSQRYNRIGSYKKSNVDIITGTPIMDSPQVRYLEKRLDVKFDQKDLEMFKIIWDMNNIYPYISDRRVLNSMPNNRDSISFLSDDKSVLLSRSFSDENGRWRKIKILPSDGKSFYTMKTQYDLFRTQGRNHVCIAEGIVDIISVYMNFCKGEQDDQSIAMIATLGSDYVSAIDYIISKGILGKNTDVDIYIDDDIDEKSLIRSLRKYKWLFGTIQVIRNVRSKDVGVPVSQIKLAYQTV